MRTQQIMNHRSGSSIDEWSDNFAFDDSVLFDCDGDFLIPENEEDLFPATSIFNDDPLLASSNSFVSVLSSSNSDPAPVEKKTKQKRIYKPRSRVYIPKLVKTDIRNQYTTMYANVLNMQDYFLWKAYFNTYFRPDVVLHMEYKMTPHPNAPKYMTFQDSVVCCDLMYSMMLSCPDVVLSVSDVKICLPSVASNRNAESTIVASFLLEGTHMLDIAMDAFKVSDDTMSGGENQHDLNNLQMTKNSEINKEATSSCETNGNCSSTSSSDEAIINRASTHNPSQLNSEGEYIMKYTSQSGEIRKMKGYSIDQFHKLIERTPLLSETTPLRVSGTFTMHLDENKMLTKFTVHYHELKSKLIESKMNEMYGCIDQ